MRGKGKLNIGFDESEGELPEHYELKEATMNVKTLPSPAPLNTIQHGNNKEGISTTKEPAHVNGIENQKKEMEQKRPERAKWANKTEFLLSCISLNIGFGNIWRFPFVALENGGGAFLIPYMLVLLFIGRPLYYLEFCLGQFSSSGPIEAWELLPAFKGVGYGQVLANWLVSTYYVFLMGTCLFFFCASFSPELPWASCGLWAGESCVDDKTNLTQVSGGGISAAEEYLVNEVFKVDHEGFRNGIGLPDVRLSMCLVVSWIVIFLTQANGIKTSGKAAYFTSIVPYALLLTLLIRGVTLSGSTTGIMYFLTPRWEKLLDVQVWFAAVTQALYSLAIGFGTIITLASYNDFKNNIYVDATITSITDTVTSLLSGITTFSILGHLAEQLDKELPEVVQGGGASLAFISYPDVLAKFPWAPQLFSAAFFLMMFTLGLGSTVVVNNVLVTSLKDKYPKICTWKVTLVVCLVGLFSGLIYTTPQGQHVLTLVNHYSAGLSILLLVTLEVIGVMWLYGLPRLILDIRFMLNRSTGIFWKACWFIFDPIFLAAILIYSQMKATVLTYGDYVFGQTETGVGIVMSVVPILLVPAMFLVEVIRRYKVSGQLIRAFRNTLKPSEKWGPREEVARQDYDQFRAEQE